MDTLDILAEIFARFGAQLDADKQQQIQATLLPLLDHVRAAIRKRVTTAIGFFVVHINDALFFQLIDFLISRLQSSNVSSEKARTLIQCCGVLR